MKKKTEGGPKSLVIHISDKNQFCPYKISTLSSKHAMTNIKNNQLRIFSALTSKFSQLTLEELKDNK